MTTVGAIRRSPRDAACGCAQQLGQRGLVVGAEEGLGVTDPDGPVGAGGVVDEVRQRLGDRGPGDVGHERVQLGRGPADVERATYGLGGEPVDGRPTPRLHLGRELQPAGQVRLERAGGDGGQVRLEQHVVHRLREQGREERRGVVAGEQRPGVRRHAAQRDQAQGRRLAQGPRHLVAAGARAAGTQPGQPRDERRRPGAGRQHVAVRDGRDLHERGPAGVDREDAGVLGGEGGVRLARGVPGADQAGQAAGAPPGARHPRPALGRRQAGPGVEVVGRGEDRVAVLVVAAREQPSLRGDLHEQRRGGLVDVQVGGGGLELAHPQTAGAQLGRRVGTPVVEQQLETADHLERRAGRRPLHQGRRTLGRRQRRDHVDPLTGGVPATQGDADLARHPDLAARARRQQPPGEQLLGRRGGVLRQHGVAGRPGGGLAAALVDVLQQRPGGGTELGQRARRPRPDRGRRG